MNVCHKCQRTNSNGNGPCKCESESLDHGRLSMHQVLALHARFIGWARGMGFDVSRHQTLGQMEIGFNDSHTVAAWQGWLGYASTHKCPSEFEQWVERVSQEEEHG